MRPSPSAARRFAGAVLVALALAAPGCSGPTPVDRDNRRLLDAILTAITMKNAAWLEEHAEVAETRHRAGQLSHWEHEQLAEIISKARAGDWQMAEQKGYEFRKAHPFVPEGQ